jgi:hypothetical protein
MELGSLEGAWLHILHHYEVVVLGTGIASQGPAIGNIYPNNNGKTVVATAGPTDSIP